MRPVPTQNPAARAPFGGDSATVSLLLLVLLIGVGTPVLCEPALAFHDGGAATCEACHVMHDAAGGDVLLDGTAPLLTAATASDVCLTCHGGPDGVMSNNPLLPAPQRGAGDFVFLLEDNINDSTHGQSFPLAGHAAGHSIVSVDYGLQPDPRWSHAPGGNFPSAQLGCTSCHDPHGNSNFRMLHGAGEIQGGASVFLYDAPDAEGLDITDPTAVESRTRHTAYRAGMSNWCANCHGLYHDDVGREPFRHPTEENLDRDESDRYNRYEGTTSPNTGTWATAYLPEVPLEKPDAATTSTTGAGATSRLMCLTCHRAHASSAPAAGRWDFHVSRLSDDGIVSGSHPIPSPYGSLNQGSLCGKCHVGGDIGLQYED